MGDNMEVNYNICKMCIYSEYKGVSLWFCTKYKKECNELWNNNFNCKNREEL